jgi:hypothetical protein
MLAQAHGSPGIRPAGRSPVVLHPNASHGLATPYGAGPARRHGLGSVTFPKSAGWWQETIKDAVSRPCPIVGQTHATPQAPAPAPGFAFEPGRWDGEPVIGKPAKCSQLLWADPGNLPPDTVEYTAAIIRAIEHGTVWVPVIGTHTDWVRHSTSQITVRLKYRPKTYIP